MSNERFRFILDTLLNRYPENRDAYMKLWLSLAPEDLHEYARVAAQALHI